MKSLKIKWKTPKQTRFIFLPVGILCMTTNHNNKTLNNNLLIFVHWFVRLKLSFPSITHRHKHWSFPTKQT